jgi:DNA-binding LacI/PurR family transcriptional regulator
VLDSRYSLARERRHVTEMAAQRMAGLAIAPVGSGESIRLWQELRPGAPTVVLNGSADGMTGISRVRPDDAASVGLAMRRVAALGHAAVGFLSAPRHLLADPDRLKHFRRLAAQLEVRPYVMYSPLSMTDVQRTAVRLLSRPDAPTAIITIPITRRTPSTRRRGSCHCRSARECPWWATMTCPTLSCWTRRWPPSRWTSARWAAR